MSRPLRIECNNAWYHVMNRGGGRKAIFRADEQREYFLGLLSQTAARFNADWHAYCLMGNHYHLMLHTPDGNLQRIMRHINGVYTQYYNRSERKDGALFRGRYKAILIDAQTYWLHLSRYIHRNPLEAGMVTDLRDYPWSSYCAYTTSKTAPEWLSTEYILRSFSTKNRRLSYKRFVAEGVDEEMAAFYSGKKQAPVMGDESFRQQMSQGRSCHIDIPELKRFRVLPSIATVASVTANHYQVDETSLWMPTRGRGVTSPARSVAMYLCQEVAGMGLSEIAAHFGMSSYASAGSAIRKTRLRRQTDVVLDEGIKSILLDLTP